MSVRTMAMVQSALTLALGWWSLPGYKRWLLGWPDVGPTRTQLGSGKRSADARLQLCLARDAYASVRAYVG